MTYTLTEEKYAALRESKSAARRAVVKRFGELVKHHAPIERSAARELCNYPGDYFSGPALRLILDTLEKEFS